MGIAYSGAIDCGEEVVEGPVGACGVAGGVEVHEQAAEETARQSLAVLEQPACSAAWQHVSSTYLVCAGDQGTPAEPRREFPVGWAASWNSTPATTPSSPSRPPSVT